MQHVKEGRNEVMSVMTIYENAVQKESVESNKINSSSEEEGLDTSDETMITEINNLAVQQPTES